MSETLAKLRRRSWANYAWIVVPVATSVVISFSVLTIDRGSDRKLHVACDRVVERLLTTRDSIELERSRILVNALRCGVERRLSDWPSSRTGGLVP